MDISKSNNTGIPKELKYGEEPYRLSAIEYIDMLVADIWG